METLTALQYRGYWLDIGLNLGVPASYADEFAPGKDRIYQYGVDH